MFLHLKAPSQSLGPTTAAMATVVFMVLNGIKHGIKLHFSGRSVY